MKWCGIAVEKAVQQGRISHGDTVLVLAGAPGSNSSAATDVLRGASRMMSARGVWFARTGVEGGPQMVMVHGSLDRSTGLSRLTRRFDDRYDILRFDRRGYGKSGEHEGPFTVAANVDDLVDLVEQEFPTGPIVLVSHSFGGNVVLAASSRLGRRVTHIATYEMPMSWQPWWAGNSSKGFPEQNPEDSAEAFMRRLVGTRCGASSRADENRSSFGGPSAGRRIT